MDSTSQALEKTARAYNAAADHYDSAPLAFWERYGRRTVERLKLSQGARVLDAGCGSGASAMPTAEAVGPAGFVLGVDLAENLLALAREKAQRAGHSQVEFRCGDMMRLGDVGEFDAVVSVFSVFFAPDIPALVRELWSRVKAGGVLAITTWGPRFFEPVNSLWWNLVAQERPDLRPAMSPWEKLSTPPALRGLLQTAGIEGLEIKTENGRQELRQPEDAWSVVLGSGYRWTVEQLGPDAAERVRVGLIRRVREERVTFGETNVIYSVVRKA